MWISLSVHRVLTRDRVLILPLYVEKGWESVLVKRRQKRRCICIPDEERSGACVRIFVERDYVKHGLPPAYTPSIVVALERIEWTEHVCLRIL